MEWHYMGLIRLVTFILLTCALIHVCLHSITLNIMLWDVQIVIQTVSNSFKNSMDSKIIESKFKLVCQTLNIDITSVNMHKISGGVDLNQGLIKGSDRNAFQDSGSFFLPLAFLHCKLKKAIDLHSKTYKY